MANNLFTRLKDLNVTIKVVNDKLDVKAPKGVLNKELLDEIKAKKEDLLNLIKQYSASKITENKYIPVAKKNESYPLSSSQQRLWTLSQIDDANKSYNMPGIQAINEGIDIEAFMSSLRDLIKRHEILRTVFKTDENDEVRQFIEPEDNFTFSFEQVDVDNDEDKISSIIENEYTTLFDLAKDSLFRGKLIRVTDNKWIFCFVMHHIISDGWSMNVIVKELLENYSVRVRGEVPKSIPLDLQYKDYAVWQQDQLVNGSLEEEKKYWLNHLRGELPVLSDFGDFPRPAVKTYNGGLVESKINTSLYQEFKALCSREEGTLFMGCLSLLNVFLHKYSGQEEFIIGSPVSGRTHAALHDQIGFYVNTLALRNSFSSENSFAEVFEKVKKNTLEAFKYQTYPFDELLDDLQITRDLSRNALFDVMISVYNENHEVPNKLSVNNDNFHSASKFDLLFTFTESSDDLGIGIEYNSDIFSKSLVEQMLVHMEQLLANLIANSRASLSTISCLRREEKRELIEDYNATGTLYEAGTSILSLFEDQVNLHPEKAALVYEDVSFTYSGLDGLSTQLSHYLASNYELNREELIAIQLPKSPWQIISILGVIKLGCAYVPIASDYPQERIDYILSDTDSKVVITEEMLSDFESRKSEYSTTRDMELRTMSSLAYVMYTSGSTGYPKGVLVEDSGIIRLVKEANYVDIPSSSVVLSTGSFSFDATTFEYWGMLLNGGTLILSEESVFLSAVELSETIRDKGVTMMWFTSGLLNQLVDESIEVFEGLETLLTGGDRLSPIHIGKLKERYPSLELINGYGPTENTTFSICHRIQSVATKSAGIPIGNPINNSSVYILDKHMNLVPKGVTGELYLGGLGVSRGYLNRSDLTQERFISSPFVIDERLYKTGDLGKWNQFGEVEFVGREDNQVKIRGFRIELGEIEHVMSMYPGVNSSLAIVEEAKGDKQIIGYVTSEEDLDYNDLRSWLSQRLPSYMVPSYLHVLEQFPLTVNGKVDRSKLPSIEGVLNSRGTTYLAPESSVEQKLSVLWMELLNVPRVGLLDNFFELGGHSLKATKLISRIHKEFNVKLRLLELFNHPDLQSQSALITSKESEIYHAIPQLGIQESYPLSLMQRRLWILSQLEEANVAYNMPGVYVFKGALDISLLEASFKTLISRHEILRTYFKKDDLGDIRQYIRDVDRIEFKIGFVDARGYSESEVSLALSKTLRMPFNLSEGPLLRINLYQVSEDHWVFSSVIHHIICDGWSMEVLVKELLMNYNGLVTEAPLDQSPLRIQYKDYASWQLESLKGSSSDKEYWLNHFSGSLPVLDLSGGKPRPAVKTYNGDVYERKFSKELSNKLTRFLQQEEATLFMGLLGAVNALFYHYTSQEDIIIGSPISGRDHRDLEDQIGFYVNTLALRTQFSKEDNFEALLSKVKEVVLGAHAHQLYPFDELVSSLGLQRDMSRNPLFDVQVIVQNSNTDPTASLGLEGLSVESYTGEVSHSSVFDLVFNFIESEEGLIVSTIYNTDVFEYDWLVQMHTHLETLLEVMLASPTVSISQLSCLSAQEEVNLLEAFKTPKIAYDEAATIVSLIEAQAKKTPEATAVYYEGTSLSYQELDEQSNQLAHYLIEEYGVVNNDLVGIMMDRSEQMFIGVLAILKTGGAYVPIDPEYPESRKSYILKDTQLKVLLTQSDYIFDLSYYEGNLFAMDLQLPTLTNPTSSPEVSISSNDLVYIIYTSGSTGNPKGVLVSHGNLMHSLAPRASVYGTIDRFLLLSSIAFDSSVAGIFSTLSTGGQLCITKSSDIANVPFIANYIVSEQISHLLTVPSYYRLLLDSLSGRDSVSLKGVTVAGEYCPMSLITDHYASHIGESGCDLFNEYGPTECTVWSTVHKYNPEDEVTSTIGKPIANTPIYLLSEEETLVPVGVVGELCIGGAGVTQGYLNRPDLTAEKFVDDPFNPGGKMYKTGDYGRWKLNGEIEFLGRKDDQVKIRGNRVELGEIQNALESYDSIQTAIVLAKANSSGTNELYAYIKSDEDLNVPGIKKHLGGMLPGYAIPSNYTQVESFPTTSNGKIDMKALLLMDAPELDSGVEYVAPSTVEEQQLVEIWQEVLNKEKVGIKDHFFDLGGDSIKVLKIVNAIYNQMQIEVSISDIYTHDSVLELSNFISENKKVLEDKKGEISKAKSEIINSFNLIKESVLKSLNEDEVENIEDIYPMTDIQKGMIYESSIHEGASIYHDQMLNQRVFKNFNESIFKQALQLIASKHEILRTSFNIYDYDEEVQIVHKNVDIPFVYEDISNINSLKGQEEIIRDFLQSELKKPFDTTKAPLFRMAAFDIGDDNIVFVSQCHHAIIDGWSDSMLLTELNNVYLELTKDVTFKPNKLKASYKDFVVQHEIDKKDLEIRSYWNNELADCNKLNIFTNDETNVLYGNVLSKKEFNKLNQLASHINTTVKEISLSAYIFTLSILNGDSEVVTGLVTNNRPSIEDGDKLLGCFLNTIPLQYTIDYDVTIRDFIKEIQQKLLALKKYERLSLLEIATLNKKEYLTENPYFDAYFNYVDFYSYNDIEEERKENLEEEQTSKNTISLSGRNKTNTYLDFNVNTTGNTYHASISLTRKLKSGFSVEELNNLYFFILKSFIEAPNQELKTLSYLTEEEKQKVLYEFNNTKHDFPETTLPSLFAEQVEKTPEKVALVYQDKEFTFGNLNEKSNQLAHYLKSKYTLKPNDLVAVALPRSEKMIITLLAIHKAGSAYVPIDPNHPKERVDYVVKDSGCKLIITEEVFEEFECVAQEFSEENLELTNAPTDIAYVIYTSGSTGNPKGCILEHKGVVNRIEWMWDAFNYSEEDVILQKTTFTFDVSVWEIFMPLCWGTKMVLCSDDDIANPQNIASLIKRHKVSCLHFVPSMLNEFINTLFEKPSINEELNSLRLIITSGEALQVNTVKKWYEKLKTPIKNLYGPTEASIDVTYYDTSIDDDIIPIGKPIWNTSIYILDANKNLVPIGCSGEIYLAGIGLAKGYLNKKDLTEERFVDNPFVPGEKMYKTGDLGKWTPDGNVIYIGRNDNQLKIRGFRIELGEIEKKILEYQAIDSVVVLAKKTSLNEDYLVAFTVSSSDLDTAKIKSYLKGKLPEYMIPSRFVQLEALPLTLNGKLDRKKLLAEDDSFTSTKEFIAPVTSTEKSLGEIWSTLLGEEKIGINDDFFELGGHSLKAIQLMNKIRKVFQVQLQLKKLFDNSTLSKMAKLVDESSLKVYEEIPVAALKTSYPLSSAQRRLWFLSQFKDGNIAYNMPKAYVFEGEFDKEKLQLALFTLIERYEILRTVFKDNELGEVNQFILKTDDVLKDIVTNHDFRGLEKSQIEVENLIAKELSEPFNLEKGPLLRVALYQIEDSKWIFTFTMHHIISDGWSQQIFFNELIKLYTSTNLNEVKSSLSPLRIQYKDYAVWEQTELSGKSLEAHKNYWLNQFKGELPVLERLGNKPRPQLQTFNGGIVSGKIESNIKTRLKELLQDEQCTLYMGLLSMVNVLLYKYTEQKDIIIGSPIAGRNHLDAHNQIGLYVNTLALRTQFEEENTFKELLQNVKELTLNAYEHQVYPFDEILNNLDLQRDLSRNPLFDVMVSLENTSGIFTVAEQQNSINNLKISGYNGKNEIISKFDLSFDFVESDKEILFNVKYNSDIFTDDLVQGMVKHFIKLVENVVEEPFKKVQQVDYLDDVEISSIINEFSGLPDNTEIEETVISLFEKQVEVNKNKVALVFNDTEITYGDLENKANKLANILVEKGLRKEESVAIIMDRSIEMIVSMLGIIKAGGVFVPIDINAPKERIAFILEDIQTKNVLINQTSTSILPESDTITFIKVNEVIKEVVNEITPNVQVEKNDLMYIIYTSGTTGNPKGVLVEHEGVVNLINSQTKEYNIEKDEAILSFSNYVFDASIEQIFLALLNGVKLVVPTQNDILDYKKFESLLRNQKITHLHVTPSYLSTLIPNSYDLKRVVVGGEVCSLELAKKWAQLVPFFNTYGPTEATVTTMVHKFSSDEKYENRFPIGKPIENISGYVLGSSLELKGVNMVGELYIGGVGVTRGYLNQESLTKEKFINNPFKPNEILYKTGDLVRWLPNGEIEYLERIDEQIKIRGYRVELSEIEETIRKENNIQAVTVLVKESGNNEKELIAFVSANVVINIQELITRLKAFLPYYMIPSHIIQLEFIPRTVSGKVDKKKLLIISNEHYTTSANEVIKPENRLEEEILEIWREVLSKEELSVTVNFFEVGGHSLKAIKLQSMLKAKLGLDLSIVDIYNYPTVRDLSRMKSGENSHLITLHYSEHTQNSIYFIPPIIGNSILFQPLAKYLANDFNSYGLQYKGLNNSDELPNSIEEMAIHFSNEIKKNQKNNPSKFKVFGYSLGAVLAFETVKILEKDFPDIDLVLVDRPTQIGLSITEESLAKDSDWLLAEYEKLATLNKEEKEKMRNFLKNNLKLGSQFKLKGKVTSNMQVFESLDNEQPSNMMDWKMYTNGDISHTYIEGTHWEALSQINYEKYLQTLLNLYSNEYVKTI
ncbi:non-ribosomal peptide synthetase [Tenacibaculum discolor]|uniref:non-ribosomal peptide synthetase n=2 Tax=Tenacibaculum discolor TaxID=361581 RepID=UPI000F596454|nr:non-ribosomal peptide synthetase [Tenacibaculum discolor]